MIIKYFIQFLLILIFFFGEAILDLTLSNSHSTESNPFKSAPDRITNEMSDWPEMKAIDTEFEKFLKKWEIAGATVAIMKDDKLIYAKGFGYADKEKKEKVQPYHLFRIASVSKLFTAVAVMKLIEEKRLGLDDKVFGKKGILNHPTYLKYTDKRVEKITVGHLLRHQGGWNRKFGDQMFMALIIAEKMKVKAPPDLETIIRYSLSKKLHFDPGTLSAYSNFGYCILSKVIEKTSGMPYEEYLNKEILNPLGIYDMKIAGTLLSERTENEVKYYEPEDADLIPSCYGTGELVPRCYGGTDYKALAAAGGWISSAVDMAKFLATIDGYTGIKDILSEESIESMSYATSTESPMGWRKTSCKGEWWRTGTLAGTAALIKRQNEGICYVVITNTGTWKGPKFYPQIELSMDRILSGIKSWPSQDLFAFKSTKKNEKKKITNHMFRLRST